MRAVQRGYALIIVLWGLGLITVLAGLFVLVANTQVKTASNILAIAQAEAAAEAGVQLVASRLISGRLSDVNEDVSCRWPPDILLFIEVEDERGKVNLNLAGASVLADHLQEFLGDSEADVLAQRTLDFRDIDGAVSPGGAEAGDYAQAGIAYGPKNSSFDAREEFDQILGLDPAVAQKLRSSLTVLSARGDVIERLSPNARSGAVEGGLAHDRGGQFLVRVTAVAEGGLSFVREAHLIIQTLAVGKSISINSWLKGGVNALPDSSMTSQPIVDDCATMQAR